MKKIFFLQRNSMPGVIFLKLFVVFTVFLSSCKHDNFEEFVGPGLCPGKNFAIIQSFQLSDPSPDLNFGGLRMTAEFTEAASWTIKLTGQTSGAQRVYAGKSRKVDVTWNGQPGNMTFFKDEYVQVDFSISCRDELAYTTTIPITANTFNSYGMLASDFDGNGLVTNTTTYGYNASGWSSYATGGTTYNSFAVVNSPLSAPTGAQYLHFNAQPAPTSWWSGGVYASLTLSSLPTTDPDSIYFNVFVHSHPTTSLTISLLGAGGPYNKTFDLSTWTGWKYISYKLSDVGVTNPLTLNGVEFGFGPAKAAGDLTEVNLDFVYFTPWEPLYQEQ